MRRVMVGWMALASACVAGSTPLGSVEQQGSSSTATGGAQCPEDSPPLGCPYNGGFGACGEQPDSELDEQCCPRPRCECQCGADPIPLGRPMCIPPGSVDPDWCASLRSEAECERSEWIDLGLGKLRSCHWVPVHEVRFEKDACVIDEAQPRCMTLLQPDGNGCFATTCMLDEVQLHGAVARPLDASSFELVAAADVICGVGIPLDDWIPADDPSLGPCALDCGG
jgi:hypothetical protein